MNKLKKIIYFILTSSILVFVDQYSKYLAIINLKNNKPYDLIKGILQFYYYENEGAAFGILQGQRILFFVVTIIVIIAIIYYYIKIPFNKKYYPLISVIILIFSGAIGNFIDRILKGYVVDFIYFIPINFPIFNVADSYITVSCFALLFLILFYYKENDLKL